MGDESSQNEASVAPTSGWSKWLDSPILPVSLALVGPLLVTASLLRISRGNPQTAFEVARSTGTASVIIAIGWVAVRAAAFVPWGYALGQWYMQGGSPLRVPKLLRVYLLATLAFAPVFVAVLAATLWLLWGLFLLAAAIVERVSKRLSGSDKSHPNTSNSEVRSGPPPTLVAALLAIAGAWVLIPDRPWVPHEVLIIDTSGPAGGGRFSGFVLDESPDRLRVMQDSDRVVFDVPVDVVERRFICDGDRPTRLGRVLVASLATLYWDGPSYPDCSEEKVTDFPAPG